MDFNVYLSILQFWKRNMFNFRLFWCGHHVILAGCKMMKLVSNIYLLFWFLLDQKEGWIPVQVLLRNHQIFSKSWRCPKIQFTAKKKQKKTNLCPNDIIHTKKFKTVDFCPEIFRPFFKDFFLYIFRYQSILASILAWIPAQCPSYLCHPGLQIGPKCPIAAWLPWLYKIRQIKLLH